MIQMCWIHGISCSSSAIGFDYVWGKFGAAEDAGDALCIRSAAKAPARKPAGRNGHKIARVRLARSLWVPYVINKTYAPDAAGSVA